MTPIRKSPLHRGSPFPPYGRHTTLPLGTALYHSTIACGTLSGIAVTYATEDRNSHLLGSRPCSAGGAFSPIFDPPAAPTWACVSTCHQVHAQAPHPLRPSPATHVHVERLVASLMRDSAICAVLHTHALHATLTAFEVLPLCLLYTSDAADE